MRLCVFTVYEGGKKIAQPLRVSPLVVAAIMEGSHGKAGLSLLTSNVEGTSFFRLMQTRDEAELEWSRAFKEDFVAK